MNNVAFLGYAVQSYDTSRDALLRFTIGAAIAYHGANVAGGNGAGDEMRAALKAALRKRGEDRKTADRQVNNACRMAAPLIERFAPDYDKATVADVVADVLSRVKVDASNVSRLAELLGVKQPAKEKEAKGASLAEAIAAAADGNAADAETGGAPKVAEPVQRTDGASLRDSLEALVKRFGMTEVNAMVVKLTTETQTTRKAA